MAKSPLAPEQIWLVLVARGPGVKTLEQWIAPPGPEGYRKILRQANPKRRAVAAVALSSIGALGAPDRGWWCNLLQRLHGPQYAIFRMNSDTGLVSLDIKRAKNSDKAATETGEGVMGAYLLDTVRDGVRSMRRLLDTQNERLAHFNVMTGNFNKEETEEEMNLRFRPDKWTEPEIGA